VFRDHADPAALAVAGEVALDVNGGTGCELGEVGDVEGSEDDPVAVDPLAGGVAPGEKEEAEITGRADGAGEAGHQADEARPVHCRSPSSASTSGKRRLTAILLASAKACASSWCASSSTCSPLATQSAYPEASRSGPLVQRHLASCQSW
jgi:hypothetical protein